jgi:hypothetical protein
MENNVLNALKASKTTAQMTQSTRFAVAAGTEAWKASQTSQMPQRTKSAVAAGGQAQREKPPMLLPLEIKIYAMILGTWLAHGYQISINFNIKATHLYFHLHVQYLTLVVVVSGRAMSRDTLLLFTFEP